MRTVTKGGHGTHHPRWGHLAGRRADSTIVYDRHGDDTLSVVRLGASADPSAPIALGNRPGIYDFRVIKAGYADWLLTNQTIGSDGCDPVTVGMMIFMQPVR